MPQRTTIPACISRNSERPAEDQGRRLPCPVQPTSCRRVTGRSGRCCHRSSRACPMVGSIARSWNRVPLAFNGSEPASSAPSIGNAADAAPGLIPLRNFGGPSAANSDARQESSFLRSVATLVVEPPVAVPVPAVDIVAWYDEPLVRCPGSWNQWQLPCRRRSTPVCQGHRHHRSMSQMVDPDCGVGSLVDHQGE